MKKIFNFKIFLTLFSALLLFLPANAFAEEKESIPTDAEIMAKQDNTTIISINGVDIPKWLYNNGLRDGLLRERKHKDKDALIDENTVKAEVLENIIDMEILYQEAKKQGFAVNKAGATLRRTIASARYRKNPEEYRRVLAAAGMTEEQYTNIWQQQGSVNNLLKAVILDKAVATKDEIKARYEQEKHTYISEPKIEASHILVLVKKESTEEERSAALKKIENVHKLALEGKDFNELAKEYSEEPSAELGGNLGFFAKREMVKSFADAAFALKVGEISDIVETKFGFHVIKKTAEQDMIPSLEEMRARLSGAIKTEKGKANFAKFKEELAKKADIDFKDTELEKIYETR